jgi:pantetheine-phosphate adenylyltransferase
MVRRVSANARMSSRQGARRQTARGPVARRRGTTQIAVVPGSFDPLTNGHVDIIERSLGIFDRVVVGVLNNPSKQSLFAEAERVALLEQQFARYRGRISVVSFSGLLVEFVKSVKSRVVVRGLRAISDFDYEAQMSLINRTLDPSIETFFLTAREEHAYISSTIVKQVAMLGGDVSGMVPPVVARALAKKRKARATKPKGP